ncbi:neuronal acetylcholine receptor subunit eat-2-like [Lingula anatina]|uniref:Neuronal acetylcholine receptor subunit eat-2-like n=1 Tax=Lingula anatina TaxID=7574 RepID=A0A1S3HZF7_LINAN|nr:neuronal acetylcholine receptor subunit eat-2-like [Lingula anatina]|eukprot:XP_013391398.1 neuronal acetylcholine receptor subunit eat-2-like [Lingula anatina]
MKHMPNGQLPGVHCSEDLDRLTDHVTARSRPLVMPVSRDTGRVTVTAQMYLSQIFNLDEVYQMLSFSAIFVVKWNDGRLAWNASEFGNISSIALPLSSLWIPDLDISNSADENALLYSSSGPANSVKCRIFSDGNVQWTPHGSAGSRFSLW